MVTAHRVRFEVHSEVIAREIGHGREVRISAISVCNEPNCEHVRDKRTGPSIDKVGPAPEDLAIYEDRVALRQGRKQVYGSQVYCDDDGCKVGRLVDPLHVDDRRKAVGLGPLADYVRRWNIIWDATSFAKSQEEDETGHKAN